MSWPRWRFLRVLSGTTSIADVAIVQVGLLHDEVCERNVWMLLVDYRAGAALSEESLQALVSGVVRDRMAQLPLLLRLIDEDAWAVLIECMRELVDGVPSIRC